MYAYCICDYIVKSAKFPSLVMYVPLKNCISSFCVAQGVIKEHSCFPFSSCCPHQTLSTTLALSSEVIWWLICHWLCQRRTWRQISITWMNLNHLNTSIALQHFYNKLKHPITWMHIQLIDQSLLFILSTVILPFNWSLLQQIQSISIALANQTQPNQAWKCDFMICISACNSSS